MTINLIAFEGDGIGPEIMQSTLDIIEFLNVKLELKIQVQIELIGLKSFEKVGTKMCQAVKVSH